MTIQINKVSIREKLKGLQAGSRNSNQVKVEENYDEIIAAIDRGVTYKAIRKALAEEEKEMSPATFKRLLDAERERRAESNADEGRRT